MHVVRSTNNTTELRMGRARNDMFEKGDFVDEPQSIWIRTYFSLPFPQTTKRPRMRHPAHASHASTQVEPHNHIFNHKQYFS